MIGQYVKRFGSNKEDIYGKSTLQQFYKIGDNLRNEIKTTLCVRHESVLNIQIVKNIFQGQCCNATECEPHRTTLPAFLTHVQ